MASPATSRPEVLANLLTPRLKVELEAAISRPNRMRMSVHQTGNETAAATIDHAFALVFAPGGHLVVIVHVLDVALGERVTGSVGMVA